MRRSFVWLIFLLAVLLSFYPSSSNAATKKALLVGINTYEKLPFYSRTLGRQITNLKGSVNDVTSMKGMLVSRYGFRVEDIRVLTDDKATREAILNTFERWLIRGTKEGDLVFFYFSGHGTQIPDQNGDEEDGMDEALCPYDLVPVGAGSALESRAILDDEIGVLLRRLKGRDVVVFVDACHSGSMTRSIGGTTVSQLEETPAATPKYMPVELAQSRFRGKSLPSGIPRQNDIPGEQIFISSSRENQVSLEIALAEGFHGALTSAIVEGMARKANMTYAELYEYARKVIKDRHRLEQDAQIEPERGKVLENRVFVSRYETPLKMKHESSSEGKTPSKSGPAPQEKEPLSTNIKAIPAPYPTGSGTLKPGSEAIGSSFLLKGRKVLLRVDPLKGASPDLMKEFEDRMKRLDCAEVTEEGYFDRLIRGEVREGKIHVRLLNRTGDVETLPPTSHMEELAGFIRIRLGYAYIVKQLARISSPAAPFRVKVWVTDDRRRDFRIGEKVVFNFSSEKDCYLYLLNVDSQGDFQILFPNPHHKGNFVRAGVNKIPDETIGEAFEFLLREPAGEEMIKAIATLEPLELEGQEIEGDKKTFPAPDAGAIRVEKIEEALTSGKFLWSEDTVVIRSHLIQ
jgi:hypothetical protein